MAKFEMALPTEVLKDLNKIYGNADQIFGGMTKAGAEVVHKNVVSSLPSALAKSEFSNNVKLTVTYKTPSDDGINTKVVITGYFMNENGERTPAPLVANMFEYGSSKRYYPKQPFFRKSFRKAQIQKAMENAQKTLSGGILE